MLCSNSSSKLILEKLLKIENTEKHQEKLKYLDIKDGMLAKRFKKDNNLMDYYKEMFIDVSDLIACSVEEISAQADDYKLFDGIGNKLKDFSHDILADGLEQRLDQMTSLNNIPSIAIENLKLDLKAKNSLFNELPDYLKVEWELICKKLISWGCCEPLQVMVS